MLRTLVALLLALSAGGCATVTTGTTHTVSIVTDPPGAQCQVMRNGVLLGEVGMTPGNLTVQKDSSALTVVCKKDGFEDARGFVLASKEGMTYGNMLIGGAVGLIVDAQSGATNRYGDLAPLRLVPTRFASEPARDEFFNAMAASARSRADADISATRQRSACRTSGAAACETAVTVRSEQRDAELDQIEQRRRRARVDAN